MVLVSKPATFMRVKYQRLERVGRFQNRRYSIVLKQVQHGDSTKTDWFKDFTAWVGFITSNTQAYYCIKAGSLNEQQQPEEIGNIRMCQIHKLRTAGDMMQCVRLASEYNRRRITPLLCSNGTREREARTVVAKKKTPLHTGKAH